MFRNLKIKIKPDDFECSLLINGINEFRNLLLTAGKPTEDVDELLIKLINESEKQGGQNNVRKNYVPSDRRLSYPEP